MTDVTEDSGSSRERLRRRKEATFFDEVIVEVLRLSSPDSLRMTICLRGSRFDRKSRSDRRSRSDWAWRDSGQALTAGVSALDGETAWTCGAGAFPPSRSTRMWFSLARI